MPTNINLRGNLATDPIRNFRFLVKFQPVSESQFNKSAGKFDATIGFTSVSGLAMSTESIPYRQGNYNTSVHQVPGQTSFSPVTFQRGVLLGSDQNWRWMKMLYSVDGESGRGGPGMNFRCRVIIDVLSHPNPGSRATLGGGGNPDLNNPEGGGFRTVAEGLAVQDDHISMKIGLANAWISSLAYSDLQAGDNAVMVEQMTLVHEGIDVKWASDFQSKPKDRDLGF